MQRCALSQLLVLASLGFFVLASPAVGCDARCEFGNEFASSRALDKRTQIGNRVANLLGPKAAGKLIEQILARLPDGTEKAKDRLALTGEQALGKNQIRTTTTSGDARSRRWW